MDTEMRKNINCEERESIIGKRPRAVESLVLLDDIIFREFIERKRNSDEYFDVVFHLRNQYSVRSNRALLSLHSDYFRILLSGDFAEKEKSIEVPFSDSILFEVLTGYLTSGFVVSSKDYGHEFWVMLAEMAEYYSLNCLVAICEQQLMSKIDEYTCQELLVIAL